MTAGEHSEARRTILEVLKQNGSATIPAELAALMGITYEAVRQQIVQMTEGGLVAKQRQSNPVKAPGRPLSRYYLTMSGEHAFPKLYDKLASHLIDSIQEQMGEEKLRSLLSDLTESHVARLAPQMQGKDVRERFEALKNLYQDDDPYMEVEEQDDRVRLIERNCPFLNVALAHPSFCSATTSALSRLVGAQVVREERFQKGDRRCVFSAREEEPIDLDSYRFEFEK